VVQGFKSLGVPGFNAGGVVGGNTNINASGAFKIDMDLLAYKIAQANRMLPALVQLFKRYSISIK
jgi:hypothetical protein